MPTDYTGGMGNHANISVGWVFGCPITITGNGNVNTIGVNWFGAGSGYVRVALYSAGVGKPANLLTESASVAMNAGAGWQDIPVALYAIVAGSYWVAIQVNTARDTYYINGSISYYAKGYGAFDAVWSAGSTQTTSTQWNMRVTYTAAGWTGTISGVTNPAKVAGVAAANIAEVKGVA